MPNQESLAAGGGWSGGSGWRGGGGGWSSNSGGSGGSGGRDGSGGPADIIREHSAILLKTPSGSGRCVGKLSLSPSGNS